MKILTAEQMRQIDQECIRLGTPALTTRGMMEEQMKEVGRLIAEVIHHVGDESVYARVKGKVRELCQAFPLYSDL